MYAFEKFTECLLKLDCEFNELKFLSKEHLLESLSFLIKIEFLCSFSFKFFI